jgi:hypothetical protein
MKIPNGSVFRDFDHKGTRRFKFETVEDVKKYCAPKKYVIFWKYDSEEHQLARISDIEKRDIPRGVYIQGEGGYRFVEWHNIHFGFMERGMKLDTASANQITSFLDPVFTTLKTSIQVLQKIAESIGKRIVFQDSCMSDDCIHEYYINYEYLRLKIAIKNEGFCPEIVIEISGKKRSRHIPFHVTTSDIEEIKDDVMKYITMLQRTIKKDISKFKKMKRDEKRLLRIQKKEAKETAKALKKAGRGKKSK